MERLCLDRAADAVRKARDNGLPTNAPNPVAATWERAANLAAHLRTSIEARDRGIND